MSTNEHIRILPFIYFEVTGLFPGRTRHGIGIVVGLPRIEGLLYDASRPSIIDMETEHVQMDCGSVGLEMAFFSGQLRQCLLGSALHRRDVVAMTFTKRHE